MNQNIERHLYDLQYKTISKSIYLLTIEYKGTLYHYISSIKKKFYKVKRKKLYILKIVDKKLTIYNFGMINCKIKEKPFIIYDSLKEIIMYYKKWMKFDIVKIEQYNIIFEIL